MSIFDLFFKSEKQIYYINKEEDRCLKAPYKRLYTHHVQAVKQKKQLKRGGAQLFTFSKIKGLKY